MKKLSQAYRNIKEKAGQAVQGILASPRVVSLVNRTTKKSPFGKVDPAMLADQKPASLIHQISARASQLPIADSVTAEEALLDLELAVNGEDSFDMGVLADSANPASPELAAADMIDPVPVPPPSKPASKSRHAFTPPDSGHADYPHRIYLDYASLTPIDSRVQKVMIEAMDEYQANPSSLYKEGVKAKKALHDARVSVAQFFGAQPDEVIFTSGGTESNNLAFQGVILECERKIREVDGDLTVRPHVIISTIEHPSIVEIALDLTNRGYDVSFIPVSEQGLVDPRDVKKALRPETVLVSIMHANNEIGAVQPIKDIAREVRHYKKGLNRGASDYPYMHTDACQSAAYEEIRLPSIGVDMVTIDGGKIYGPRGIGALIKRRHVALAPVFQGGSQEFGLRAGTENLPAIIGLKHALDIAHSERDEMSVRMKQFQETMHDLLFARLSSFVPGMSLNGHRSDRLPNNLNICFPKMDAEFLVLRLDALGVALSSVTSCRASNEDSSSYVIEALGRNGEKGDCAASSLRITFGRFTTAEEVAVAIEKIVQAVKEQVAA